MATLLRRLRSTTRGTSWPASLSLDDLHGLISEFAFNGHQYPLGVNTTWAQKTPTAEIAGGLEGHLQALMQSSPAFAAQWTRSLVLSQARFVWRNKPGSGNAGRTFGTTGLQLLEQPWPNGTTGELITKMEWHAGLAGNAYVLNRRTKGRLVVLRPDWVTIVYGSPDPDVDLDRWDVDAELLGYVYHPGGIAAGKPGQSFSVDDVAHWAPIPDPTGTGIGMSWLTPVVREIQGDIASTTHKLKFFEHGATPNLVVTGLKAATKTQFDELVAMMEGDHKGLRNAYRTLYLTSGADATVVGANLKDLDLKGLQGSHETRIAAASKVPATILNISEGLSGSSLNAGNFGQARRNFADTWLYPTLGDLCGALGSIVTPPQGAELWHATDQMPFVREDAKDAAEIEGLKAETTAKLIEAGFEPASVVAAVQAQNMDLLKHTGLVSVQLQAPGTPTPSPGGPDAP